MKYILIEIRGIIFIFMISTSMLLLLKYSSFRALLLQNVFVHSK